MWPNRRAPFVRSSRSALRLVEKFAWSPPIGRPSSSFHLNGGVSPASRRLSFSASSSFWKDRRWSGVAPPSCGAACSWRLLSSVSIIHMPRFCTLQSDGFCVRSRFFGLCNFLRPVLVLYDCSVGIGFYSFRRFVGFDIRDV